MSLNEIITAEQKLEYLKEISIIKVEDQDFQEKVLGISEKSDMSIKIKSPNIPVDTNYDLNILENLKVETDFDDTYCDIEDIPDISILPEREIKEEENTIIARPKGKSKLGKQKKTNKCKIINKTYLNVLKIDTKYYDTECRPLFKKKWFQTHINLLNIVPGSLEGFKSEVQENSLKCSKCKEVCYNEKDFTSHMKSHFQKYMCRLCADDLIYNDDHIIAHMSSNHRNANIKCRNCKMRFISFKERQIHYNECGIYKCNDCTEVFKSKKRIGVHCSKHLTYKCIDCNVKFKHVRSYNTHNVFKHSKIKTEAAYCVECDKHFPSDVLMRKHLKTSCKHVDKVPKSYPCSECPNVYAKSSTRNYHYNKVHVGITKYYCQPCDKYYLNNYKLRMHKATKHDKIPTRKDKLCPHCGRAFSSNKVLQHHISTHTGERPYECSYCGAKYAQKYARNMHMKNIHKHGINTYTV